MKDLILSIFNIFKYVGKFFTILRNTFFNILFLFLIVLIIFSWIPSVKEPEVKVKKDSILRLDVVGNIVEERKILSSIEQFFNDPIFGQTKQQETLLQDILDAIQKGAGDPHVLHILLNLKDMGNAGINQLDAIGRALESFKENGKEVIAAEDYYTQPQYYLASFASSIYINPMGGVDIHGLGVYRLYFKEVMDNLKINYNIFKVGTYKSALEPFTRTDMSAQDRQQNEVWLSRLWKEFSGVVTENREISAFQLRQYTDNTVNELEKTGGDTARLALQTGLVDDILTRSQVKEKLKTLCHTKKDVLPITTTREYLKNFTPSYTPDYSGEQNIGLIVAEGNIMPGKQPTGLIGGDSLSKLIDKAAKNKEIKALVLRINSGGGSAFASEIIRQALLEFKKTNKPLLVSMGSLAASGGYWIAADADQIWAEKSTITGSIGIFGAIPTFEKSLESIGVSSDGIGTTPMASGLNLTMPLAAPIKDAIQLNIEYNYRKFLDLVSSGRDMKRDEVAKLAEGRVYDGMTAKEIGLVDELGSLEDVIQAAGKLAGLPVPKARYIQPPPSVKDQLFQYLTGGIKPLAVQFAPEWVREMRSLLKGSVPNFASLEDPAGIYAVCEISPYLH